MVGRHQQSPLPAQRRTPGTPQRSRQYHRSPRGLNPSLVVFVCGGGFQTQVLVHNVCNPPFGRRCAEMSGPQTVNVVDAGAVVELLAGNLTPDRQDTPSGDRQQRRGHLPRAQIRKVDAALRAHLAV